MPLVGLVSDGEMGGGVRGPEEDQSGGARRGYVCVVLLCVGGVRGVWGCILFFLPIFSTRQICWPHICLVLNWFRPKFVFVEQNVGQILVTKLCYSTTSLRIFHHYLYRFHENINPSSTVHYHIW